MILNAHHVPGASIGVISQGKVLLSQGFGYRDLEKKLPVTEKTLFPLASITKTFTAHLFSQLVASGKIHWDDRIVDHLPEFKLCDNRFEEITLRDLLSHQTGIQRHDPIWMLNSISKENLLEIVAALPAQGELRKGFGYSNFMYGVTGILLEKILNQSWEEALSNQILQPLKMDQTHAQMEMLFSSSNFSRPYAEFSEGNREIPLRKVGGIEPAAAIISDVDDLLKWTQHLLNTPDILKELGQIQVPFPLPSGESTEPGQWIGYGLGIFVEDFEGRPALICKGSLEGFATEIAFLPDEKLAVIVLTNSGNHGNTASTAVRKNIFAQCLGMESSLWIKDAPKQHDTLMESLGQIEADWKIEPAPLSEPYLGSFYHPAYGKANVYLDNGQIVFQYGDLTLPLSFQDEGEFIGYCTILQTFGINPLFKLSFKNQELAVHFDSFRSLPPAIFKKEAKGGADETHP